MSTQEIHEVAQALSLGYRGPRTYTMVHIIARTLDRSYEQILASFLTYETDPQVAALALHALGVQWKLAQKYRGFVAAALAGLDWDGFGDVQRAAVTTTGELLRESKDCDLLEKLLDLATRINDPSEQRHVVRSVARAVGFSEVDSAGDDTGREAWSNTVLSMAFDRFDRDCSQ